MDLLKLTIGQLLGKLNAGEISSVEVTKAVLNRINERKEYNAYITVCDEQALSAAQKSDERRAKGDSLGLLEGVPIAVKDNISTSGILTTCASAFLSNYTPVFDATVVKKLREAGAVIVGKTNMDEFAMGSTNRNSYYGAVLNAVDPTRVPGGSSGGSACAVADYECFGALGSDTGGSIRQPASYNGIVGLKPTYSTVSRFGLIAFASSLDQIGPLTRSVSDNALMMNAIAGHDPLDSTSYKAKVDYLGYEAGLKDKTVGIVKEFFDTDILSDDVKNAIYSAAKVMERAGATVKEVSLSAFDAAIATYYVLACAEATSNLARFDGIKYGVRAKGDDYIDIYYKSRTAGFGDEVKRRIMIGNYVLSSGYYDAYYLKASKIRTLFKSQLEGVLSSCDAIIGPTAPTTAPALNHYETDKTKEYYSDLYTVIANITGNPAMSIPCGVGKDGLPIGIQLIGRFYDERTLFSIAEGYEREVK